MNTLDIKTELQELINNETDKKVLEAILVLLKKSEINPVLKEKLTARALKSQQNIIDGKVYTRKEAEEKIKFQLGL